MRVAPAGSAMIALLSLTACRIQDTFSCTLDEQCGSGGRCEPIGYCSFPDAACADGRRYDELAGEGHAGACVSSDCPAGYTATIPGLGSRYRAVGQPAPWLAAQDDCADDGAGTHLVVIGSELERSGIRTLVDDDAWIGFSDRVSEGAFRWVNGAAAPFTAWANGQPDNTDGTEDCAEQRRRTSEWQAQPCEDPFLYVCECDGVAPDPAAY